MSDSQDARARREAGEPDDQQNIPLGSYPDVCTEIRQRVEAIRRARPKGQRSADEQQVLWVLNFFLARLQYLRAGGEDAGSTIQGDEGDTTGIERMRRTLDVAARLIGDETLLREVETHVAEARRLRQLDDILPAPRHDGNQGNADDE